MKRWYLTVLGWLQAKCLHLPHLVTYDIGEGDLSKPVSWCRVCGAFRIDDADWNRPHADWWRDELAPKAGAAAAPGLDTARPQPDFSL